MAFHRSYSFCEISIYLIAFADFSRIVKLTVYIATEGRRNRGDTNVGSVDLGLQLFKPP